MPLKQFKRYIMHIYIKEYNQLTQEEINATLKLRLKYGMLEGYLDEAKFNMEVDPRLKPCTKIILAKNHEKIIGWALYTPEATTWQELCKCKRLKNYYLQLYVDVNYRRKGIGSAIIETAIKRAKKLKHQLLVFPHDHASSAVFSQYKELKTHPGWD